MPDDFTGLSPVLNWLFIILYYESVLRLATVKSFKSPGIRHTALWSSLYACVLTILLAPFSGVVQVVLTTLIMLVLFFLYTSQLVYYKIFKMFYTLYTMGNAGQILDFVKDIVAFVASCLWWVVVLLVPPATYFLYLTGPRLFPSAQAAATSVTTAVLMAATYLVIALLLYSAGKYRIQAVKNQTGSAYEAYHKSMDPTVTLRYFGLLTTMRLDFQKTVLGMKSMIYDDQQLKLSPPDSAAATPPLWPSSKYNALPMVLKTPTPTSKDNGTAEQLNSLHHWLSTQPPTPKNNFTGLFKGCNLILITAESMSSYSIHKDLTPTLFKMVQGGVNFTNFYNPIWGVSTSDGEYVACTGLLPKCGIWSFIESAGKNMPMALGNQLRPLGYTTTAYHNHRYSYYKRHLSHPNLGYTYIGLGNGLDVTPTWPESDLEMMQLSVPKYVNRAPFHTYYMTVSGHMRYSFKGNAMAAKNRAAVDHLDLSAESKAYLATQVELDLAMASLLEQLESAGVADRTLIAMSADHYPYGLSDTALDELAGHKVDRTFELYRSPFVLYNPGNRWGQTQEGTTEENRRGQTPLVINTPCSSLDILPTLSNLMGLDYDARLLMGRDIFSDSEPLVMFLNKSFITSRGRYDALKKHFVPVVTTPTPAPTDDYIREVTKSIEDKFLVSARILDLDYYSHLK